MTFQPTAADRWYMLVGFTESADKHGRPDADRWIAEYVRELMREAATPPAPAPPHP